MAALSPLVDLPAPCLLPIMRHCSSDARSLCSAARAHSSLCSAAVAAHTSITLHVRHESQLRSLLRFLTAHGQHVKYLHLSSDGGNGVVGNGVVGNGVVGNGVLPALQFPPSIQLESLVLSGLRISIALPDSHGQHIAGVLTGQSRLQTLSLKDCIIDTIVKGLAAALRQLPALQHLHLAEPLVQALDLFDAGDTLAFPEVLPGLGLTSLELGWEALVGGTSGLHYISSLTALQSLRIFSDVTEDHDRPHVDPGSAEASITASMLAPLSRLTSLRLECDTPLLNFNNLYVNIEPGALLHKPNMQDLRLPYAHLASHGRPEESCAAVLLAGLHCMQQLTHLNLQAALRHTHLEAVQFAPPLAAYTALRASSTLQYLDISDNEFPAGLWQQLFDPPQQLLQLRVLRIDQISYKYSNQESAVPLTAADAQRLASCCPGLQQLSAYGTLRDAAALAALSPLSCLRTLLLDGSNSAGSVWATLRDADSIGWAQALAHLTGLVDLTFGAPVALGWSKLTRSLKRDMLQLAQLRALTRLEVYDASPFVSRRSLAFRLELPGGESGSSCRDAGPVWQQLHSYLSADQAGDVPTGRPGLTAVWRRHR